MSLRASTLVGFSLLSATALANPGPVNVVIVSNQGQEAVIQPAAQPQSISDDAQRSLAYFAGATNQVRIRAGQVFLCADFASVTGRTSARLTDLNGDQILLSNVSSYGGFLNDTGGFRLVRDGSAGWQLRVDVSGSARCYGNFPELADLIFRNGFEQFSAVGAAGEKAGSVPADLQIEVTSPANVVVGQPFSYVVRVRNLGDEVVNSIQVRDWYPKVAGASQAADPVVQVAGDIACEASSGSACGSITQGGTLSVAGASLAARGTLEYTLPRRLAAGTPNTANFRVRAAVFGPMALNEPFGNNAVLSNVIAAANDAAPSVVSSTPNPGATVAANTPLQLNFSEQVNASAGAVTLSCTPPGGSAQSIPLSGTSGNGITVLSPTYAGTLPFGASCTLRVLANLINDVDVLDPPDNMTADYVATFSVDAAPVVTGGSPANQATGVALNSTISYVFNEPVTFQQTPAGAPSPAPIRVSCNGNPVAGVIGGSGTNTVTFTPNQPLPGTSNCTVSGNAEVYSDLDSIDPPDQPASIPSRSFSTTDAPPAVVATTPANGSVAGNAVALSITFSEPVDTAPGAVLLTCNGNPVTLSGVAGTFANPPTMTPTYSGSLPDGGSCTLRVVADRVFDKDDVLPVNMVADEVVNFTIDSAPGLTSFAPSNNATNVGFTTPVVLNFSEPVNISSTGVRVECPTGTPVTMTGLPANNVTQLSLVPQGNYPASTQCTVTVDSSGVRDSDAFDPPDGLSSDTVFRFTTSAPR
ncbi:MAG: Ig-like domain-containing protein [Xanthomonadales bacterium]|jgi:methionine-rich copper-binding protein CopC|nr:Ig-like domain-containing protein [Xanthomonadales bacterium]